MDKIIEICKLSRAIIPMIMYIIWLQHWSYSSVSIEALSLISLNLGFRIWTFDPNSLFGTINEIHLYYFPCIISSSWITCNSLLDINICILAPFFSNPIQLLYCWWIQFHGYVRKKIIMVQQQYPARLALSSIMIRSFNYIRKLRSFFSYL